MATSGEQISNPDTGFGLRFLKTAADTDGELLEMEATYEGSSAKPVEHFHPHQREHFEILEGTLHARIGGEERALRAGDTLDVEAGVPHAMWNQGPERARTLWQTRPALKTENFFETIVGLGGAGKPGALQTAVIANTYRDEFRTTSPPQAIQSVVVPMFGTIGRLLGRKA
jgi:mannose-6-phosphate isomerase-like protein (cupin superfamily)